MQLRQLNVRFLPGIEQGFSIDEMGAGINVIMGPNGSGKSSLRRLATSMLWPALRISDETRARAVWHTRQGVQQVDVGSRIAWQRNGVDVATPDVPDVHLSSCYALDLRELLAMSGDVDQRLAARLRIELSAGYDLRAIREAGCARPNGRKEEKRLSEARRELSFLRRERERLATQEDNLGALRKRFDEARRLSRMKSVYDNAIEYVETVNALREAQAAYEMFPAEMARIRGDEPQAAQQIERDIESDSARLRQQETALQRAQEEAVATRISVDQLDPAGLQATQLRLRELRDASQTLRQYQDSLARLSARREDAACALGIVGGEDMTPPGRETLGVIDAWLKDRSRFLNQKAQLDARLELLARPETPQTDPGVLQTGMNYLRRWLAISNALESFRASNTWVWVLIVAGLLGVGLAFGLTPWCIALTGACIGSMAGRWGVRRHLKAKRLLVQSEFDHIGIPVPGVWQESAVQDRLEGLELELTEASERSRSLSEFEHLSRERDHVREQLVQSDQVREHLLTETGLDPNCEDLLLSDFAHRLVAAREACAEYAAGASALAAEQERVGTILAAINVFLGAYELAPVTDTAGAEAALDNVKARTERFARAADAIAHAQEDIAQIRTRLKSQRERSTAMYVQLGIKGDDLVAARAQVQRLCDRRDAYQKAIDQRNKLSHQHALLEARLQEHNELKGASLEALMEARATSIAAEGELEALQAEIADIVARLDQERSSSRFEDTTAEVVRSEDVMCDAYDQVVDAVLHDVLLDHIEEKHLEGTHPEVFSAATRYFTTFTQGQYELILGEENGETRFAARDAAGRGVALAELSDGTRIQLLLAARLAFAASEERGDALPIWLDEALTTSDRTRFVAIVEALAALAAGGRQVFYLTSNPLEAALITSVCREGGSKDVKVHDLARLRKLSVPDLHAVDPDLLKEDALPAPGGMTSLDYAHALHVPGLSVHARLDDVHLYHVLFDDLDGLYTLLQLHVTTLGQWRLLSDKGQASLLLSDKDAARLNARIDALGTFLKSVQTGRGKPLDERVLKESGAVTDVFLPRLAEIATEQGGDARAFIERLEQKDERAKGYRQAQFDMLRDYLESHGYLDDRALMSAAEVSIAILSAAPVRRALQMRLLNRDELLHAIEVWSQPIAFPDANAVVAE